MNKDKLKSAISSFVKNKKANAAYYDDNWKERMERRAFYQSFTKDKILGMTEEDFLEYMSKLWAMLIWGNKKYLRVYEQTLVYAYLGQQKVCC